MTSILFIANVADTFRLEHDKAAYSACSHSLNLFRMAHEARRMGWDVYIKPADSVNCQKISAMYPLLQLDADQDFSDPVFQPDIIAAVFPQHLLQRAQKPKAIGVFVNSAHFWLENALNLPFEYVDYMRLALARDIDFILTQNDRMKDLAMKFYGLIARWRWDDRVIAAPIGFVPEQTAQLGDFDRAAIRARMGAADDDIVIINSGGAWDWTDIETFLTGFVAAVKAGATRLKFFQMGIRHKSNTDHERSARFFEFIKLKHADLLDKHLFIYEWDEASKCLPDYNYGADLGLNVNRDTVENYQAHRVRFVDYAKAGLPVLNTAGDYLASHDASRAVITVRAHDAEDYQQKLLALNNGDYDLAKLRAAMIAFRPALSSDAIYASALQQILQSGKLPAAERQEMLGAMNSIIGFYAQFLTPKS